ncbi:hypothetical protein Glaag_4581 (plasmid) [Glaciecola sp. 4H-3-7+YE-5]|jgi:hypothetical protein|nr:hypothetical protein Glaag_4581 [Glaciecola sp. 4H-3-7+YE-5]|tara:strand:- start:11845 stop:12435 length:591 start_codon:yes stop_codon:yes gene_type:complete
MYKLILMGSALISGLTIVPYAKAVQSTAASEHIRSCKVKLQAAKSAALNVIEPKTKIVEKNAGETAENSTLLQTKPTVNVAQDNTSSSKTVEIGTADTSTDVVSLSRPNKTENVPHFLLNKGRLEPQIKEFVLSSFPEINEVVWSLDTNLRWFNKYDAKGESNKHILNSILRRYQAKAIFWANNVVEVVPKQEKPQ